MAISINSNIGALKAIRQLFQSTSSVSTAFERLSSGQRINRASDDPAGLAVSVNLGAKSRVFGRGHLNAVDALSALDIADSALGQLSSIYQRMGELAEQAANGSLGASQRLNLNREYGQLDREIRRIARATSFNGRALFEGGRVSSAAVTVPSLPSATGNIQYLGTSGDGRYALVNANDLGLVTLGLYDRVTGTTTQVAQTNLGSINGSISQNGDVVYTNTATDQIYLRKLNGETTQLTQGLSISEPFTGISLSADGRFVAFTSTNNYVDGGSISNPTGVSGTENLYRLEIATGKVRAYTSAVSMGAAGSFQLSNDGSKLIFRSIANILGVGDGGAELYGIDFSQSQLTLTQITNGTGSITLGRTGISDQGEAYFVDSRNLGGQNSALVNQLWKYNFANQSLSTLTYNTAATTILGVTLSNDGSVLSYISTANDNGENPLGRPQAFRWDLSTGEQKQLTQYAGTALNFGAANVMFSGDGRYIYGNPTLSTNVSMFDVSEGSNTLDVEVGLGTAGGISTIFQGLRGLLEGLGNYTLTSRQSALSALDQVKANIEKLAQLRGQLGSSSSRLTSAAQLLQSQILEITAAEGRIKDIDVAQESAALTRSTIIQQVGAAVLAQANIQPRLALELLSRE